MNYEEIRLISRGMNHVRFRLEKRGGFEWTAIDLHLEELTGTAGELCFL
jgi:hypothetical protein